jgi:hypothetical protein
MLAIKDDRCYGCTLQRSFATEYTRQSAFSSCQSVLGSPSSFGDPVLNLFDTDLLEGRHVDGGHELPDRRHVHITDFDQIWVF